MTKWPYRKTLPEGDEEALAYLESLPIGISLRRFAGDKKWHADVTRIKPEYLFGQGQGPTRRAALVAAWQYVQSVFHAENAIDDAILNGTPLASGEPKGIL